MRLKLLWSNLFGLRFMLTILPQNTYILQEEFSESPNKLAGDILGLDTVTLPDVEVEESNILFPLLSSGPPFLLLRAIRDFVATREVVTPYMVLVLPRIWSTIISLLCDVYIYKLSINCGSTSKEATVAMALFASCHITWVFFTRTFSAGIESFLFAAMLCIITKDAMKTSDGKNSASSYSGMFVDGLKLSAMLVVGISCNPFFVAYSVFPLTYWMLKPIRHQALYAAVKRTVVGGTSFLWSVFVCSLMVKLCNEAYRDPGIVPQFTSPAFLLSKLSEWAADPYTSFSSVDIQLEDVLLLKTYIVAILVVLFFMYGPLTVVSTRHFRQLGTAGSYGYSVLLFSTMSTILMATIISAKSLTVLIPIIIPLTVLTAKFQMSGCMVIVWCAYNLVAFLVTGIEIQAGIIPSIEYLHSMAKVHSRVARSHKDLMLTAVFYETAAPSRHLAAWTNMPIGSTFDPEGFQDFLEDRHVGLHFIDGNGKSIQTLLDKLLLIRPETTLFLVMPAAVPCRLIFKLHMLYDLQLYRQFFPHLMYGKEPPDYFSKQEWCTSKGDRHNDMTALILDKLSLNLYKVQKAQTRIQQEGDEQEAAAEVEGLKLVLSSHSSAM